MVYRDLTTNKKTTKALIPGHYTMERLAKVIKEAFTPQKVDLKTELNTIRGGMTIYNPHRAEIEITTNLANLLGIDPDLNGIIDVKHPPAPTSCTAT